jgi:acyl-ACP thioesterase
LSKKNKRRTLDLKNSTSSVNLNLMYQKSVRKGNQTMRLSGSKHPSGKNFDPNNQVNKKKLKLVRNSPRL